MNTVVFKDMNLSREIQRAIGDMGFEEATPIQSQAIPHILEGHDVIGQAQTGTGKTCAFGIPAIEKIDTRHRGIQVLILCPTRELAIQVAEELKSVGRYKRGLRILSVYGGQPIERQISALRQHPQIIVGTPGRIMDHMRRRTLQLKDLKMVILDEADEMLNMGFREDIDTILSEVPDERQTLLFSATLSKEIMELTHRYQKDAVNIQVVHSQLTVPAIEQYYVEVRDTNKLDALASILDNGNIRFALVFCNTKRRVDALTSSLQARGYTAEALHGDMRQSQRDRVMAKFRRRNIDVLVATDVAARGIDVDDVEAVFNFDVPEDVEYYVHRIGRTGRAGKAGKAYTFITRRDMMKVREIQRYTKTSIVPYKVDEQVDSEDKRLERMAKELKLVLSQGRLDNYAGYVDKLVSDLFPQSSGSQVNLHQLTAALLKMVLNGNKSEDISEIEETISPVPNTANGQVRLFINIGSQSKVQAAHIQEAIATYTSLPLKQIGSIDVMERFSFVNVPPEYATEVVECLKNRKVNGRKINIEKANRR